MASPRTVTIVALSVALGLFFVFMGTIKLTPRLSRDAYNEMVSCISSGRPSCEQSGHSCCCQRVWVLLMSWISHAKEKKKAAKVSGEENGLPQIACWSLFGCKQWRKEAQISQARQPIDSSGIFPWLAMERNGKGGRENRARGASLCRAQKTNAWIDMFSVLSPNDVGGGSIFLWGGRESKIMVTTSRATCLLNSKASHVTG